MASKRFVTACVIATMSLATGFYLAAQGGETYKARLTAVPADARTRPGLAGIGSASATLAASKLSITGHFRPHDHQVDPRVHLGNGRSDSATN